MISKRAPFNVFVFIYRMRGTEVEYAVFKRSDNEAWQAISGGGRYGEPVVDAARREGFEEAGIPADSVYSPLQSISSIPASVYKAKSHWPEAQHIIYGYPFAVRWPGPIVLSEEHTEVRWLMIESATELLTHENSKVTLMELHRRLMSNSMRDLDSSSDIWATLSPGSMVTLGLNLNGTD